MPNQAHQIIASALEDAANLLDQGLSNRVGEARELTFERIVDVDPHYDDAVAFALGFWDSWAEEMEGTSLFPSLTSADWSFFARQVAGFVRFGNVPDDPDLLERLIPTYKTTLREKIRHWVGRVWPRSDESYTPGDDDDFWPDDES